MSSPLLRDAAPILLKIGSVLLLVLGIADILKGLATIIVISIVGSIAGSFLSSIFPALSTLSWLFPLVGPIIGGVSLAVGAVASVLGYQLMKLSPPLPASERDRWVIVIASLTAVALAFLSYWYLVALALILVALLLLPSVQARPPLPSPQAPLE